MKIETLVRSLSLLLSRNLQDVMLGRRMVHDHTCSRSTVCKEGRAESLRELDKQD